jgi:glycosyltransferase involved in cell wall biosynthesis
LDHPPEISVIIPVRNEGKRILEAIESVMSGRSCRFPVEIVVIDDASEDDCCARLSCGRKHDPSVAVRVVRLPKWSGIPYARNVGAAAARGGILFITDANVIFPQNWDAPIRREIRADHALCATIADTSSSFVGYGCALELPSMGVGWLKDPNTFHGYAPVAPCGGTIISASLFRKLGGYDLAMPLYGAAEPEFSVRLWLSGSEIRVLPDLVLRHHFREREQHAKFLGEAGTVLTGNYLRFGLLYLDDASAAEMLRFYTVRQPAHFHRALQSVIRAGVWKRRENLRRTLRHDFSFYLRRFPCGANRQR